MSTRTFTALALAFVVGLAMAFSAGATDVPPTPTPDPIAEYSSVSDDRPEQPRAAQLVADSRQLRGLDA